jgi:stalled ribosome rescue protein Dom34
LIKRGGNYVLWKGSANEDESSEVEDICIRVVLKVENFEFNFFENKLNNRQNLSTLRFSLVRFDS